jgi:protein-disulfide isomerase
VKFRSLLYIIFAGLCCIALGVIAGPRVRATSQSSTASAAAQGTAPTGPALTAIQQKIEAYLRHLYAWGPSYKVSVGPLKESPIPNVYEVNVEVGSEGQSDSAKFYVSKDGNYMMRAELENLNTDPLAETRKQLTTEGYPSKGPADAKVVVVEFADFECPSCKQLDTILRGLMPNFPQVRLVYKDFPLTQIHPWAATAANAGRCAYKQNPTAFWKFHDLIFDSQELISGENVWDKMQDLAKQSGLDPAALRSCMADPATQKEVEKSMAEGVGLHIANTPTIFVNGRRIIGPDGATLEQYIRYELTPAGAAAQPSH